MFVWETNLSMVSEGWEGGKSDRRTDVGRTAPYYPRAKRKQNKCTWRTPRTHLQQQWAKRHSRASRAQTSGQEKIRTYISHTAHVSAGQGTKTSSHSSPPTSLKIRHNDYVPVPPTPAGRGSMRHPPRPSSENRSRRRAAAARAAAAASSCRTSGPVAAVAPGSGCPAIAIGTVLHPVDSIGKQPETRKGSFYPSCPKPARDRKETEKKKIPRVRVALHSSNVSSHEKTPAPELAPSYRDEDARTRATSKTSERPDRDVTYYRTANCLSRSLTS